MTEEEGTWRCMSGTGSWPWLQRSGEDGYRTVSKEDMHQPQKQGMCAGPLSWRQKIGGGHVGRG